MYLSYLWAILLLFLGTQENLRVFLLEMHSLGVAHVKFIFACSGVCYLEKIIQGIVWLRLEADPLHFFSPSENIRCLGCKPNIIPLGRVDSKEKI